MRLHTKNPGLEAQPWAGIGELRWSSTLERCAFSTQRTSFPLSAPLSPSAHLSHSAHLVSLARLSHLLYYSPHVALTYQSSLQGPRGSGGRPRFCTEPKTFNQQTELDEPVKAIAAHVGNPAERLSRKQTSLTVKKVGCLTSPLKKRCSPR